MAATGTKFSDFPAANPSLPVDIVGLQGGVNVRTTLVNLVTEDANGLITVTTVETNDIITVSLEATSVVSDDVTTTKINTNRIETATEVVVHRATDAVGEDHIMLHTGNIELYQNTDLISLDVDLTLIYRTGKL